MSEPEPRLGRTRRFAGVDLGSFLAIIAADLPRSFLIGIAPLILSAFVVDRGFGEQMAAWLSSAELLGAATAAIGVSGWLTRGSRRTMAAWGLALVAAAQLASIVRFDFVPLLSLRLIAGIGAGLAGAAVTAVIAGTKNPERLFGALGFVVALIGALTAGPIGMLIEKVGAAGAFASGAAMTALVFPLIRRLPNSEPVAPAAQDSLRPESSTPNAGAALLVLVALFASMLGQNAVWTFTVQIGLTTGLSVGEVSWVLGLTALTGLGGAALATVLNTRRGRTMPLLVSIVGTVIAVYLLVELRTPLPYIVANGVWSFFFAFSMPYFIGALASLDSRGRWAMIGTGLAGVGGALGPAAAGGLIETGGYAVLKEIVLGTGLLSVVLITPVLLRIDRGRIGDASPSPSPD